MKKTILILAAILSLQINLLVAGNDENTMNAKGASTLKSTLELAPSTPVEATFDDVAETVDTVHLLAPVNPVVADFEELN